MLGNILRWLRHFARLEGMLGVICPNFGFEPGNQRTVHPHAVELFIGHAREVRNHHDSNLLELALEAVERPLGEPDVQAERLLPGQRELLLHRTPSAPDRGVGIGGGLGRRDQGSLITRVAPRYKVQYERDRRDDY